MAPSAPQQRSAKLSTIGGLLAAQPGSQLGEVPRRGVEPDLGFGRIVALYYCSYTLYY
jgi:hypothetical protein